MARWTAVAVSTGICMRGERRMKWRVEVRRKFGRNNKHNTNS